MSSIPLPALGLKTPEQPDMFGNLAKALSVKNLQQESQRSTIETQQAQQGQADQQAFRQAMTDPLMKGKTIGEIADVLAQGGHISPTAFTAAKKADLEQRKSVAELDEKTLINRAKSHEMTFDLYKNVMAMPDEQLATAWPQIAQQYDSIPGNKPILDPAKPLTKQQLAEMGPMLDMHEAYLGQEVAKRKADAEAKAAEAELPGKQADAIQKQVAQAAGVLSAAADKESYAAAFSQLPADISRRFPTPERWNARTAKDIQRRGLTPDQAVTAAQADQRLGMEGARLNEEKRHNQATEGALSEDGLNIAADNYAKTGQMPSGMRSAAMVSKIITRAAERNPGVDLASNSAEFKANQDSLKKLQGQRDAVGAFEQTALKNLDLFLDQAKGIVDTGSPFLNTPLRQINARLVGDAKIAAYEAARRVAVNEIAKVTSNPNLTGTLSDSARHEVESFSPDNATLAQTFAVAKVLRQDMTNRHDSLDMQIKDIQDRIKGKSGAVQQSNAQQSSATHAVKDGSGKIIGYTSDGKTMVPAQ